MARTKNTPGAASSSKNQKEMVTGGKVEKTSTKAVVRPYVLDVVKALADEIKLTKNMEKENEATDIKEILEIELSDTESVIEVTTPVQPKLKKKKTRESCRSDESFITIDETSFFQQQNVINLADEVTPPPVAKGLRRSTRKKPKISFITLNDTSAAGPSNRIVTLKETLLALKPAPKKIRQVFKHTHVSPYVCISPYLCTISFISPNKQTNLQCV
jgi:hypothetical protein